MYESLGITIIFTFGAIIAARRIVAAQRRMIHLPVNVSEDLPSVTVCIPARNEAHALSFCLERVLASDYLKLEILVLDDQSEDETSMLIKSFAHAGVRFIAGKSLPPGWLGKNHALDTMTREASGNILLFCDVDTRIEPTTISQLVSAMHTEKADLVSVIPERRDSLRLSVLFGHARYMWDLLFDSPLQPSAASALWLVKRETLLNHADGFNKLKQSVRPELILARLLGVRVRLASGAAYGVAYEKRWSSQLETSQRLLWPTFRAYGWRGILATMWLIVWSLSLPALLVALVLAPATVTSMCAVIVYMGGALLFYTYLRYTRSYHKLLGVLLWPWVALQELLLYMMSVLRHRTNTVTWKGRSVHAESSNRTYLALDD